MRGTSGAGRALAHRRRAWRARCAPAFLRSAAGSALSAPPHLRRPRRCRCRRCAPRSPGKSGSGGRAAGSFGRRKRVTLVWGKGGHLVSTAAATCAVEARTLACSSSDQATTCGSTSFSPHACCAAESKGAHSVVMRCTRGHSVVPMARSTAGCRVACIARTASHTCARARRFSPAQHSQELDWAPFQQCCMMTSALCPSG